MQVCELLVQVLRFAASLLQCAGHRLQAVLCQATTALKVQMWVIHQHQAQLLQIRMGLVQPC